ncbi:DUF2630 domain-containing protein [Nocardiopsis gilva YIM 90087]|uniref:DUF2630 domain-containing protein n=1 Tax=Nocardiopsis gilva YIM 90087 TaxID=1235441 RepID=A0A223S516_9ACTN|nr:DUF2630 family protein [Nocardiopsis gilva]ASU83214.1 DUF2630 domain-containing protein [Nocardiopsis gilva YIM 90087]
MNDANGRESEILSRIDALVTEERDLREQNEHRLTSQERSRMRELEESLDQCWDLLRRRRALQQYGQDPDAAQPRSADEVRRYRQ